MIELLFVGGVFQLEKKIYQIINKYVSINFKVINEPVFKNFFCIEAFFCRGKEAETEVLNLRRESRLKC